jgi:hypothetical protein
MQIAAKSLTLDERVYPRGKVNLDHVTRLAEVLRAGFTLPPITVEKTTHRIVDGVHRWQASKKVLGEEQPLECEMQVFASDADFFLAAIEANSQHGLGFEACERTHILISAAEFGISKERVASALRITTDKAEKIISGKTAFARVGKSVQSVVLKGALKALRGKELTRSQLAANKYSGGMRPLYYVNELTSLLDAGLWNWGGENVRKGLKRLAKLISVKAGHGKTLAEGR